MDFSQPLRQGRLLKRYKRFFADIEYKGEVLTAHLPNTGSLKSIPLKDIDCLFSSNDDPKRKLKHTLEFIKSPSGLAGVNTRTPNIIVGEALNEGLKGDFTSAQGEVKISPKSRIDFVLSYSDKKLKYPDYLKVEKKLHFIEVKNVSMVEGQTAFFPDGVTARGTKHLEELIKLQRQGFSTEILFVVQRENIDTFSPAREIDPLYAKTLLKATKSGVKISCYKAEMNKKKVYLNWADPLKIEL